jgi:hypothetical protein
MDTLRTALRREVRVAFSRRAQPVWFRVVKWTVLLVTFALWHDRPTYWWTVLVLFVPSVGLHLLYRHRTHRWTRAWGGWNDLPAGRD